MKKHIEKSTKSTERPIEPGHLDETLTEITSSTAQAFRRWRYPLIGAVVAIIAIMIVVSILQGVSESRVSAWNQRLYEVFGRTSMTQEPAPPPTAEIDKLLADVKGSEFEPVALKMAGNYYLQRATTLDQKIRRELVQAEMRKDDPEAKPPADTSADRALIATCLDKAYGIAADAAARFPDDTQLQTWAAGIRQKVEEEKKKDWLPPSLKFAPLTPAPTTPEAGAAPTTPEAGAAPTTPAAGAAPAAEAPAASAAETPAAPAAAAEESGSGSSPSDAGTPAPPAPEKNP